MNDSKQVFTGKSGKLIVGRDGVTIERNFAQANQQRTKRVTHLKFNEIESLNHRYAADKPGYIELKAKTGSEAAGIVNRRHKIHFDAASTHRFRRAQKQIARKIDEQLLKAESTPEASSSVISPPDNSAFYQPRTIPISPTSAMRAEPAVAASLPDSAPAIPPLLSNDDEKSNLPYRGLLS